MWECPNGNRTNFVTHERVFKLAGLSRLSFKHSAAVDDFV